MNKINWKILTGIIIAIFLFTLTGCDKKDNKKEREEVMNSIKVIINNKAYTLKLENNKTAEEFVNLLPQEFIMSELNGNEKYVYVNKTLPADPYNPKRIEKGDVMLFGSDCIVIFYKSFDTTYSYTKIGHIDNLDDLGSNNIKVKFEK